eukprot:TRINITY_DN3615_c5_g1_i1.p1 TRINITY_DN3615_c5_g1~~TRINITY_DN3615_c5_g1_i1.p1  ORF type:complete len:501 (+),score=163.55 TRINITY_DN3615_c5_g1_i1:91-1593(+)
MGDDPGELPPPQPTEAVQDPPPPPMAASRRGSTVSKQPSAAAPKPSQQGSVAAAEAPAAPAGVPPEPAPQPPSRKASRLSAGGAPPLAASQGSAAQLRAEGSALAAQPQLSAQPVPSGQGAPAQLSRQASRVSQGAAPVSRQGSQAVGPTASAAILQAAEDALVPPEPAEGPSRHPSAAALSRQGSAAAVQRELSRGASAVSASAQRLAQTIGSQQPPLRPATPPAEVDDTAGVDWRLTSRHHQERAAKLEEQLRQREAELAAAEQKLAEAAQRDAAQRRGSDAGAAELQQLRAENERLRSAASAAGAGDDARLQQQLLDLQQQLAAAQGSVVEKEVVREVVREVVPPHVEQLMDAATLEVQTLRAEVEQREGQLQSLAQQLAAAHEAILAATATGFEHDVKLHQARAALSALLKREQRSPGRMRSASPPGTDVRPSQRMDSLSPQYAYASSPSAQLPVRLSGQVYSNPHSQVHHFSPPSAASPQGRLLTPGPIRTPADC